MNDAVCMRGHACLPTQCHPHRSVCFSWASAYFAKPTAGISEATSACHSNATVAQVSHFGLLAVAIVWAPASLWPTPVMSTSVYCAVERWLLCVLFVRQASWAGWARSHLCSILAASCSAPASGLRCAAKLPMDRLPAALFNGLLHAPASRTRPLPLSASIWPDQPGVPVSRAGAYLVLPATCTFWNS